MPFNSEGILEVTLFNPNIKNELARNKRVWYHVVWRRTKFNFFETANGGQMSGEVLGVTRVFEGHSPWSHDKADTRWQSIWGCYLYLPCSFGWKSGLILMTMVSSSFLLFQKGEWPGTAWSWDGPSHEYQRWWTFIYFLILLENVFPN